MSSRKPLSLGASDIISTELKFKLLINHICHKIVLLYNCKCVLFAHILSTCTCKTAYLCLTNIEFLIKCSKWQHPWSQLLKL